MPIINIPSGKIIMSPQAFTLEPIEHILEELCAPGHDFTGFIKVVSGGNLYLLLFYNSRPYAAAKTTNNTPANFSLRDYFSTLGSLENSKALLSIHATDPVLLKSLLVFFQNPVTVKAPAKLLNLETTINQIQREGSDALIVLQKQQHLNFFFFKNNTSGAAYYSDTNFQIAADSSTESQMLAYALQSGEKINASIFRVTTTTEDSDAAVLSQLEMFRLMHGENKQEIHGENLVLKVLYGPQKGEILTGPVPCVLGRKDTDIVVNDPLVSKRHAVLQIVNGSLLLMDMNSTNGTFVNGSRIKQQAIIQGDVIMLGETTMSVEKLSIPV